MSRFETTLKNLPLIVKYALVIGVIIFISTLFPNQKKNEIYFKIGDSWDHEDLYALTGFDIEKTETELSHEKNELIAALAPVYFLNENLKDERKKQLKIDFESKLEIESLSNSYSDVIQNPNKYLNTANKLINRFYSNGILEINAQHRNLTPSSLINIFSSKGIQKNAIDQFNTSNQAAGQALEELFQSGLSEAEFLIPLLESSFFIPNLTYNDSLTRQFHNQQLAAIPITKGKITEGELIIRKDEQISEGTFQILTSLQNQTGELGTIGDYSWNVFLGYFLLTSLVIGVFLFYLQFHVEDIFKEFSHLIFILSWVVIYSYLVYGVESTDTLNAYLIPFCIAPIVLKSFFEERVALFTHIVIVLIASFLSSQDYEFTFLQMLAGIVAVLTPIKTRDWTKFFYFLLTIFGAYVLGFLGLSLIKEIEWGGMNWSTYGWIFWSVFLTLLAYPLIPLSERIFGFTSSITLAELSDINKPLLKKLAEKTPGTFQHSLQVGHLAEAAASKIHANSLLVKTAALYHDIGKMVKPNFFIENQSGKNPHDDLAPEDSAKIIIDHVSEGIQLAKKNRLPSVIIDFIKTHHGTTRVEYFYKKYKHLNPTQKIQEKSFRYSGPLPTSKEQTILLLADAIEAASKTLKKPNEETIDALVQKIVANKIEMGQLVKSELTFEELEICIREFKRVLLSINHARIEYD